MILSFAIPLLVVCGACSSSPYLQPDPYASESSSLPNWRWMPHSWEKLNEIETWLVGAGPRMHPEMVAEAELILAEGRLRFAKDEADVIPASTLRTRVSAAESGLRRVLSDPFANESIKSRARRALGNLGGVNPGNGASMPLASVLPRSSWGGRSGDRSRLTPASGRWRRITVHHSANESGALHNAGQSRSAQSIAGIQSYHMNTLGWGDIGYHFLIDPQGRIFEGRSLKWQGAHASGVNNIENLGVCLLGNFEVERPSPQSIAALQGLLNSLRGRYGIPIAAVSGHHVYKSTDCPGRYLTPWVKAYRAGQGTQPQGSRSPSPEPRQRTAVAASSTRPTNTRRRAAPGRVH